MPAKVPDFATLATEALEAADRYIEFLDSLGPGQIVESLRKDYRTKKDKALKALRGKRG